jgi:excisionase family DNA binding protein
MADASPAPPPPSDRLLSIQDVAKKLGLSDKTVRRRVAAGEFPVALRTGVNSVRWRESEVNGWMASLERAGKTAQVA